MMNYLRSWLFGKFVGTISTIDVRPDDVLILSCDYVLTQAQHDNIQAYFSKAFQNRKLIVLDRSMKLVAVRTLP